METLRGSFILGASFCASVIYPVKYPRALRDASGVSKQKTSWTSKMQENTHLLRIVYLLSTLIVVQGSTRFSINFKLYNTRNTLYNTRYMNLMNCCSTHC